MTDDVAWLERAVRLAVENIAAEGGPFGALVVRDGEVVGTGSNRVTAELDPTAHAEVVAIRRACRTLGDFSLRGSTLYTSCEPCPLCLSAVLWSRLDRVVYAANRDAAAAAGFDDSAFHALLHPSSGYRDWPVLLEHLPLTSSEAPFDAWRAFDGRTPY